MSDQEQETPREKAQRLRRQQREVGEARRKAREESAASIEDAIPSPEEALLSEIRERSREYVDLVWTRSKACPLCGHDDWGIANIGMLPMRRGEVGTPLADRGYPFIPVTCKTCGYTLFVHEGYARGEMGEAPEEAAEEGTSS